jgi:hypothetical protein
MVDSWILSDRTHSYSAIELEPARFIRSLSRRGITLLFTGGERSYSSFDVIETFEKQLSSSPVQQLVMPPVGEIIQRPMPDHFLRSSDSAHLGSPQCTHLPATGL